MDGAPERLIVARGLSKRFGNRQALERIDLELAPGEVLAVLGANGAGKSTLLQILATLLRPESGELTILGHRCPARADRARAAIGHLGHSPMVYLDLTARQNLEFYGALYGIPDLGERALDVLDEVGLLARADDAVRTFSRGMAQRMGLARVMLHRPRLLLLDEAHAGLDAQGARLLDRAVTTAGPDAATVLVTHELERALALSDRILILHRGRAVASHHAAGLNEADFRAEYAALVGA